MIKRRRYIKNRNQTGSAYNDGRWQRDGRRQQELILPNNGIQQNI